MTHCRVMEAVAGWSVRHSWAFATYLESVGTTVALVIGKVPNPRLVPIESYAPFLGQAGLLLFYIFIILVDPSSRPSLHSAKAPLMVKVMVSVFVSTLNWSVEHLRAAPVGEDYFLGPAALLQVRFSRPHLGVPVRLISFAAGKVTGLGRSPSSPPGPGRGAGDGSQKGSPLPSLLGKWKQWA